MKVLKGYGSVYALEVGLNPKRIAGNNNSGKRNRFTGHQAYHSPAG